MTHTDSPSTSPWLEARQLSCERGNRQLFTGLDFRLDPGSVLQVEGANGSGKTSLLRMLCGLAMPADGELHWRGESLQDNRSEYLEQVAYVGHQPGIKGELTPRENLRMAAALASRANGVSPAQALERLGLSGFDDAPCRHLSAGQRRRVALAALLITDTALWLLDEPFTALDRDGIRLVNELLVGHLHSGGLLAMTTHHEVSFEGHPVTHLRLGS